jgi:hypothetical protein
MSTSDIMREAHLPLAKHAYDLKECYNMTLGQTREQFLNMYQLNEIQLSSVYENLFVAGREKIGKPVTKISEDRRDFSNNGDMKITVLQVSNDDRRFVVSGVKNKIGFIYVVAWNWMTERVNYFAIPPQYGGFPDNGIKIPVCPRTGNRAGGQYNLHAYDSFERMIRIG